MIKQVVIITRLPHLGRAEFLDHWRNTHAPLVQSVSDVLGIRRYVQLSSFPIGLRLGSSEPMPWDGIAEVWFNNLETITISHSEPAARDAIKKLKADEQQFIDSKRSLVLWGEEAPIF
ncbi:EthD domain-containing protein [Kordiimonas sp.]|uniref:EthD domain-containing protein n=1 Tax=Kordiimonas sp. TaxID=1970157 RepID=UPI003A908439